MPASSPCSKMREEYLFQKIQGQYQCKADKGPAGSTERTMQLLPPPRGARNADMIDTRRVASEQAGGDGSRPPHAALREKSAVSRACFRSRSASSGVRTDPHLVEDAGAIGADGLDVRCGRSAMVVSGVLFSSSNTSISRPRALHAAASRPPGHGAGQQLLGQFGLRKRAPEAAVQAVRIWAGGLSLLRNPRRRRTRERKSRTRLGKHEDQRGTCARAA